MPDSRHTKKTKARVEQGPRLSFEEYLEKYRNREKVREARAKARIARQYPKVKKARKLSFLALKKG